MIAYKFGIKSTWTDSPSQRADDSDRGGYDFHAFCLEVMDVIWAWAVVAGAVLLLMFFA
ncbi:MAG TPA: hypothetical protein VLS27_14625 [Gammaproteobacteria bacterium]|nr:hypothetical protein [Gammaproteobacteria bacterium]